FFDIGGHSLKAMRMISRVYQQSGIRISLKDVFKAETIRNLARIMQDMQPEQYEAIESIPQADDYAVSHAQKRLWLLNQLKETVGAYNIVSTYEWKQPLDIPSVQLALTELVNRHEILRTIFIERDGQLRQQVIAADSFTLPFAYQPTSDNPSAIVIEHARIQFNLATGPLFQVMLLQPGKEEYLFLLTTHHIISDEWSNDIFFRELIEAYRRHRTGQSSTPTPLRIQYKDFSAWQNRMLEKPETDFHRNYWLDHLAGELPVLQLPTDYPRARIKRHAGGALSTSLPKAHLDGLHDLAREAGSSLFTVLLSTAYALFHRYTGAEDIILGIPVAGRDHGDLEDQLGCYINTLAIRSRFRPEKSFRNLVSIVKENLLEGYNHQLYPFDRLVDDLALDGDRSRSPLFDVMINYDRREGSAAAAQRDNFDKEKMTFCTFDLTLHFSEYDDQIDITVNFDKDLFLVERIKRMLQHFHILVQSITSHPGQPLHSLDYVPQAERLLLGSFNDTDTAVDLTRSLVEWWEASVDRYTDAPAIRFGNTHLSFFEFDTLINRLANCLIEKFRIQPGDRVGILLHRTHRLPAAIYAVLKTGAAYVPIDPAYPQDRTAFIAGDAQLSLIITEDSIATEGLSSPLLQWEAFEQQPFADTRPTLRAQPGLPAYLIYTSGSTGQPKGVPIQHRSVVNLTQWIVDTVFATQHATTAALLTASVNFDASVQQLFAPLFAGQPLIIIGEDERTHPDSYIDHLRQFDIAVVDITPSYLHLVLQLIRDNGITLPHLQTVLVGGESLLAETIDLFYRLLPQAKLYNVYGPTETCVDATFLLTAPDQTRTASIGRPLPNVRVHILDAHGEPTGTGINGELCIGGAGLAEEYWRRPELSQQKFILHPALGKLYRTGDIGRWTAEGLLDFFGRRDTQVKIRGYRVELEEIERRLLAFDSLKEAVVTTTGSGADLDLVAYIVWRSDPATGTDPLNALRDFLGAHLPKYMVPRHILVLDSIPRTPGGKLDRRHLPQPGNNGSKTADTYLAPSTPLESQLVTIWQEVLERTPIGVNDNFFDIGGHSLKAMRMISRVYQQTGIRVTLKDVFKAENIRTLAQTMQHLQTEVYQPIDRIPDEPDYPLSHAQKRLWILQQVEEAQSAYTILHAYELRGTLRQDALVHALETLTDRHEILRTTYTERNGEVRQRVMPAKDGNFRIEFLDFSKTRDQEEKLNELLILRGRRSIDLEKGPLFKATLVTLAADHFVLLLHMHHIVIDGWSMDILHDEVQQLYSRFVNGQEAQLPPLRIQYRDFAHWQNRMLEKADTQSHRQYWLQQFSGDLPVSHLPTDYPRPPVKQFRGAYQSADIDPTIAAALQRLGRDAGCSLYTVLLATVNTLFHRYTGTEDVILGVPVAGQEHVDLEGQIGYYVNTLAIRSQFSGRQGFRELLVTVKERLLDGYTHQLYPFDQLVDDLQAQTDRSRSPLFDVMVTTKVVEEASLGLKPADLDVNIYRQGKRFETSKYDLTIHFAQHPDYLHVSVNYDTDLFTAERISRLLDHYSTLLHSITLDPDRPIQSLEYLSATEQQLLKQFNATDTPVDLSSSLVELWEQAVDRFTHAPALRCDQLQLS
ncbi:MAG TPA: amino acid adenylation domain-containing protein, partial [Puia sp.]|uniref:non-ribosomal peptide synthetase n=1 Tax=Puia sp. TaxID=2045100 RepID=UPI002BE7B365